jgi:hypothetical protein
MTESSDRSLQARVQRTLAADQPAAPAFDRLWSKAHAVRPVPLALRFATAGAALALVAIMVWLLRGANTRAINDDAALLASAQRIEASVRRSAFASTLAAMPPSVLTSGPDWNAMQIPKISQEMLL